MLFFAHFIWSHLIAASLGNCSLHPTVTAVCVFPSHLNSSHVFSTLFHLMSALRSPCLLSHSQLFSADHDCSFLFSCHLSLSHLFSSQFLSTFLRFSQLFSTLLSSHLTSSHFLFPLFSHLLSWSQILSARHTSYHGSSQRALKSSPLSSSCKSAPKTDLGTKASDPYAFHREGLTEKRLHTANFCTEKFVNRFFFTEIGKFLSTENLYTQQFFTQRIFARKVFYTQQIFTRCKLLLTRGFTYRSF